MASIEVGIRIDTTAGISFFGIEAVNKQLAAGLRIRELRAGGMVAAKKEEADGNVTLSQPCPSCPATSSDRCGCHGTPEP